MKKSILVVADFPNWAYHSIQQFIKDNLSDEFDIYCDFLIFNTIKKSKNPINIIKLMLEKKKYQQIKKDNSYDIVLYLSFYFDKEMRINYKAKKIIKGIYTDGFPPSNANFQGTMSEFKNEFLHDADAVVCGSELIKQRYEKEVKNVYYANDTIDEIFVNKKYLRGINNGRVFRVGWTGNPKREFKGFYSHVIPAVELAQKTYPDIELKSRFSGPLETLPDFYKDVDVILIASDADAGPSLFSEASVMRVPSISTDMGMPHEVIKDGINGFFVDRNVDEMAEKIIMLYENRELLFNASQLIKDDYMKKYDKNVIIKKWRDMFNNILMDTQCNH